jgi:hypothetical protein
MFPFFQQLLRLYKQHLLASLSADGGGQEAGGAYSLSSRVVNVSVGIEKRANVHSLTSPQVSLHCPV